MKLSKAFVFCYLVMIWAKSIESAPIPPNIIAAIEASDMTVDLQNFVVVDSNLLDTDSDGNTVLELAAFSSFSSFLVELFNLNPTGFMTILNQPNNFDVTPMFASLSNPNSKYDILRIVEFLLRLGAH